MNNNKVLGLFDEFDTVIKDKYFQFKLNNEVEIVKFLKQFIILTETAETPYKHKAASYKKKAHYINNKKVNKYVYNSVKNWLDRFN